MTYDRRTYRAFRRTLERAASEFFAAQQVPTKSDRPYIPEDEDDWHNNLIDAEVSDSIERKRRESLSDQGNFALHQWAHHGLSSQAMAFNLVGKLIARNDVDAMRAAFEQAGAPWPGDGVVARLEVEDRKVFAEYQKQPTSFDLVIDPPADRAAASLFVEVKLVEKGFGTCSRTSNQSSSPCSGDNPLQGPGQLRSKCELARIGREYWDRLKEQGLLTDAHRQAARCPMADHYQFYREAAFALHKGGHYVLLADVRNPCFVSSVSSGSAVDDSESGLWHRLRAGLPPQHRERLHFVSLQSVVAAIRATGRHSDWIEVFAAKYAIDVDVKTMLKASKPFDPFVAEVLGPVRQLLDNPRLRVPSGVSWSSSQDADGTRVIGVGMTVEQLNQNMQTNIAAAPTFAVCLAYWLQRATGATTRVQVRINGAPPDSDERIKWLHYNRSQLLLRVYEQVLGSRFEVVGGSAWQWPASPALNEATGTRSGTASRNKKASSEHHLEVALSTDPRHRQAFGEQVEPIERLRRQLPVGLFEGNVAAKNAWLPRGSSQVDLWTTSTDGKTLHLFELKAARNVAVGIVPEALCYAWLLRNVATGLADGTAVRGGGAALAAVRRASQVVMWLSAPRYHPLVWSADGASHSPLVWFNEGLSAFGIELRVLLLALESGDAGAVRWVFRRPT